MYMLCTKMPILQSVQAQVHVRMHVLMHADARNDPHLPYCRLLEAVQAMKEHKGNGSDANAVGEAPRQPQAVR